MESDYFFSRKKHKLFLIFIGLFTSTVTMNYSLQIFPGAYAVECKVEKKNLSDFKTISEVFVPKSQVETDAVKEWMSQSPAGFIENLGQMTDVNHVPVPFVLFRASAPGMDVYLTEKGLTYVFIKSEEEQEKKSKSGVETRQREKIKTEMAWINLHLAGASIKREHIIREGESREHFNFFYAHCPDGIYGVKQYERITITDVYPGIDWVLYNSTNRGFKYDFVVHPGADPEQIQLIYSSLNPVKLNSSGGIEITTEIGTLTENAPYSYTRARSTEGREIIQEVASKFQIAGQQHIHPQGLLIPGYYQTSISFSFDGDFSSSEEQRGATLVIDPQLWWATFYGGNGQDGPRSVVTDNSGNVFVTGYTWSIGFPVQNTGTFFQAFGGLIDAFILKFDNTGKRLWATCYGGTEVERGHSITTDNSGNLFVTGETSSTNFPVRDAGTFFQEKFGGGISDAFILKFTNAGVRLWATYYGGAGIDRGYSIAADVTGNVFLTGETWSTNFPVQNSGTFFQGSLGGRVDAFILKFDNSGNRLWATYYGGAEADYGYSIAADVRGNVFVTGETRSLNFPVQNAGTFFQGSLAGGNSTDAFILKFDNPGNRFWATYYGGSGSDFGYSIAADGGGNVFVTGITLSINFPLKDAGTFFQGTYGLGINAGDAFILKFDTSGNRLWATYYGDFGDENFRSYDNLAIDAYGTVYISFETNSTNILTQIPCDGGYNDSTANGELDNFIVHFSNTGVLIWATYLGGNGDDFSSPLAVDNYGNLFISGEWTLVANNATYPLTDPGGGAYYSTPSNSWNDDGFMVKFSNIPLTHTTTWNNGCGCDGNATVMVSDGCPPYNYLWSNGQTAQTATGLCAGNYTVTVTDMRCRSITDSVIITPASPDDASFHYSSGTFCQMDTDPSPIITGLAGGVFTSAPELSIDSGTGLIDLAASTLGTYTVSYTTNGPCPNTSTFNVTIALFPDASFSYDGPYCQNETPDPTPIFPAGSSAGAFSATPPGLIFISTISGQIDLSASAPGTYTVTNSIVASGGCASASADATVIINPAPVLNITNPAAVCNPEMVDLTAASITAGSTGGGTLSYWLDHAATNALVSPGSVASSGTYYIQSTTDFGCVDIEPVTVIIYASSSFTATSPVCTGTSSTITYTGSASANAVYNWNFNDGTVVSGFGQGPYAVFWPTPGVKNITLTVTEAGCISPVTTQVVTVNPQDNASFSYSQNTFCQSGTDPFPIVTGLAGGAFTSTAGLNINASTGLINLRASTPGSYIITHTTNGTCPNASTFNIVITSAPDASFFYNGPYCQNETPDPSPVLPGGSIAGTFSATPIGLVFISTSTGQIDLPASVPGTYTVTNSIPASGGCAATSANDTVIINQVPVPNVASGSICEGQSIVINATAQGGTLPYTYSWDPGAMTGASVDVSPSATTTYIVTVKDLNNCIGTANSLINVFPPPEAYFSMVPPSFAPLSNPVISFTDQSAGANQWFWNFGDALNSFSTLKDPFFTYIDTGTYQITLIVKSNEDCTDTTHQTIYIQSEHTFYIPNAFTPDNDGLNDFFGPKGTGFELIENFQMIIYNRWGEEIYRNNDINKPWDGKLKNESEISKKEESEMIKQDVYVYKIGVKLLNQPVNNYVGNVTIIR